MKKLYGCKEPYPKFAQTGVFLLKGCTNVPIISRGAFDKCNIPTVISEDKLALFSTIYLLSDEENKFETLSCECQALLILLARYQAPNLVWGQKWSNVNYSGTEDMITWAPFDVSRFIILGHDYQKQGEKKKSQ